MLYSIDLETLMSKHPIGQPWLTAIYRVPTKPSTLRVGVWKQAKELGGLAIQQSTYLFPDTPEVRLGLSQLMRQVEQGGGEGTILEIPSIDPEKEAQFVADMDRLRDEEYAEVAEDLEEIISHIDRKVARGTFDESEIEDARGDLDRARALFESITSRDYFVAPQRTRVLEVLQRAQACLEEFSTPALTSNIASGSQGTAPPEDAAPAVKIKTRDVLARADIIERLHQIVDELERDQLAVNETQVGTLPPSAVLEVKFLDRNGKRKLELEVEW
jgi:hypothetical protein